MGRIKPQLCDQLLKATEAIGWVIRHELPLEQALARVLANVVDESSRGAITDLSFYGLRSYGRGLELVRAVSSKSRIKPVFLEDFLALCCALLSDQSETKYLPYTLVDQAVYASQSHAQLHRAQGFVNACLRNLLRQLPAFLAKVNQSLVAQWSFPLWWINKVQQEYPDHWQLILEQANEHPPMVLRVNRRVCDALTYQKRLHEHGLHSLSLGVQGVLLFKPVSVEQLPGFRQGHVSVQDSAAQMAVPLLNPQHGQRVLDCCAAPGGKTGHLLEWADIDLLALDSQAARLEKVHENYVRIQPTLGASHRFQASAVRAEDVDRWWDGQEFDLILADLPCSGSGVVRRHPDIRWLRQPGQLNDLSQIQHTILDSLWSTLKPGGTLLQVTCSIFAEEGRLLTDAFLAKHADAKLLPTSLGVTLPVRNDLDVQGGLKSPRYGLSPDGFSFALFNKAVLN